VHQSGESLAKDFSERLHLRKPRLETDADEDADANEDKDEDEDVDADADGNKVDEKVIAEAEFDDDEGDRRLEETSSPQSSFITISKYISTRLCMPGNIKPIT
tara:strand:+ start:1222 stop:1530 length:309 start_codon:yes stop_codon:yes gene_type:complete